MNTDSKINTKRSLMFILLLSLPVLIIFYPLIQANSAPKASIGFLSILDRLLEGNRRFVQSKMQHPDSGTERRAAISGAQHPFAIVVACSDSRVPPEMIFDQGLGDLFVIRTAGNLVDSIELGSIEYAVEHLDVNLIVVLGHQNCGVIKAFLQGGVPEGHIKKLIDDVSKEQEIHDALKEKGDSVDNCVRANIRHITRVLRSNKWVQSEKQVSEPVTIVGARYDLATGKVEMIE